MYRVSLTPAITDLTGNPLAQTHTWQFAVSGYTTVAGMVQLEDGSVPEGAPITVYQEDGAILAEGSVQQDGSVRVTNILFDRAQALDFHVRSGPYLGGVMHLPPISGGITDMGTLILSPWEEKLLPSDGPGHFGQSVSMSGDLIIAGARENDEHGDHSGAAYIFQRVGNAWRNRSN